MPASNFFVIKKYVGVHSCSLLSRNASHHQATYVVVGEQVDSQFLGAQKGPAPKAVQSFARMHLKAKISYYKAWRGGSMPKVSSGFHQKKASTCFLHIFTYLRR